MTVANWLDNFRSNQKLALERAYKENRDKIIKTLISKFGTSHDTAKDLCHRSFLILYENTTIGNIKPSPSKLSTYLISICKYKLFEMKRDKLVSSNPLDYISEPQIELSSYVKMDKLKLVTNAIDSLGVSCKRILDCYYFEQMSMAQIALQFGYKNKDTVKNLKYKCLKRLLSMIHTHKQVQ